MGLPQPSPHKIAHTHTRTCIYAVAASDGQVKETDVRAALVRGAVGHARSSELCFPIVIFYHLPYAKLFTFSLVTYLQIGQKKQKRIPESTIPGDFSAAAGTLGKLSED